MDKGIQLTCVPGPDEFVLEASERCAFEAGAEGLVGLGLPAVGFNLVGEAGSGPGLCRLVGVDQVDASSCRSLIQRS